MATYVARVELERGTLLERADVTVEQLDAEHWRGRFFLPSGMRLPRQTTIELAFADGRRGRGRVDHIHPALSKRGPRLVEIVGAAPIS